MLHLSYWEKETWFRNIDFLIVGGGIVGLSAAIELKRASPLAKVLVVEKGILPSGASTKNAGFACFGSIGELLQDLESMGEQATLELIAMRWNGLKKLRSLLNDSQLGYEASGNFELFHAEQKDEADKALDHISFFNGLLKSEIGESVYQRSYDSSLAPVSILNQYEGMINTGKMMSSLQQLAFENGVLLLTGISVKDLQENENSIIARIDDELRIKASKILVATNGFASQLLPELDVEPGRAQVLITKPLQKLPFTGAFHVDKGYYYFRNVGNRVLLGGGRNIDFKVERTFSQELTYPVQDKLESLLSDWILKDIEFEIDSRWAGTLGLGKSRKPIIKSINKRLFCAVRMGGMGVAIGSLVGEKAARILLDN